MKHMFALVGFLAVACGIGTRAADASPIVLVSGDSNITNALNGTFGAAIDPGNQQFFLNILQGGTSVVVDTTTAFPETVFGNAVNNFYNASGVSSTLITSPVTDVDLAHVNLFVSIMPDSFSTAEIDALTNFLSGGGSVFFLGDNFGIAVAQNTVINNTLAALGSNLAIALNFSEGCVSNFHTLHGNEIANDPLTAGVSTFTCAAGSTVFSRNSQGLGSTALFTESNGNPLVIYEPYGTPFTPVPEPASLILFCTGAGVLWAARSKERLE
jgi:hypothetical protein